MVKRYPRKAHVRRVIKDHLSTSDTKDFLKKRGIFVYARKKQDLSKIGGDFYFNQDDYSEFKKLMDTELNFKKSGRFTFNKNLKQDLEEAIIDINNKIIDSEDNTKLIVSKNKDGNLNIILSYDEYKPSLIDLLDRTSREIEMTINTHKNSCSLDYNMQSSHDYKKVKEVLEYISYQVDDIKFAFDEISINRLPLMQRIELFEKFFKSIKSPWKLKEINKLKVKRDSEEDKVTEDQLQGINSALLDGSNLIQNRFVKDTLAKGFYFSMASMRLDKEKGVNFIDLVIDFKARPEMCEVKISNSGKYLTSENDGLSEVKSPMDSVEQDELLMIYKNNLSVIYSDLLKTSLPNFDITINDPAINEVAMTLEEEKKTNDD